jgi:patatin-like phospholipase/acyl hydrolase
MMRRILSIDGGGIKGVFPAAFLAHIEQAVGRNVSDYFDLIVGTSTGGIIALGLGLGFSAEELLNFYRNNADKIFPKISSKSSSKFLRRDTIRNHLGAFCRRLFATENWERVRTA